MNGNPWNHSSTSKIGADEWKTLEIALLTRSGGLCEIRTTECLAPKHGILNSLTRRQVSIHHRKAKGMGGTPKPDINNLSNLVIACGTGNTGCHGYVTLHPQWAEECGWIVTGDRKPADVPITLHSGRRVTLDDIALYYLPPADGQYWAA